jgi:hypothetical protein
MIEHRRHQHQTIGVDGPRFRCHDASNPAHSSVSVLSKAVAMDCSYPSPESAQSC